MAVPRADVEAGLDVVVQVLSELVVLPEQSRQMLVQGLPHALASGATKHDYQAQFLTLVEGALRDAHQQASDRQHMLQQQVGVEQSALEEQQASVVRAAEGVEVARQAAADKQGLLQEAKQAVTAAEAYLKETEREQGHIGQEHSRVAERKNSLSSILEGSLRMLAEGGWEDEGSRDAAVQVVLGCLQSFGVEKTLLAAAPAALAARPEARRPFDGVVISHVRELLQEQLRDASAELEQSAPTAAQANAEALGAWALLEVALADAARAHDISEASAAGHQAAVRQQEKAQAGVKMRIASKQALERVLEQAAKRVVLAKQALDTFSQLIVGAPATAVHAPDEEGWTSLATA